jgi:Fe-S cluster biosynthesis and repair protein YggX
MHLQTDCRASTTPLLSVHIFCNKLNVNCSEHLKFLQQQFKQFFLDGELWCCSHAEKSED